MRKYFTNMVIKAVKPNVPKTNLEKAKSRLAIQEQITKGSGAKLKQTLFEAENPKFKGKDFTFGKSGKKSESKKERYKRIQKENTKVIGRMFKKALKGDK